MAEYGNSIIDMLRRPIESDDEEIQEVETYDDVDFNEVWTELGKEIKAQVKFEKGNHEKYKQFRPSNKPCERINELMEIISVKIQRKLREIDKGFEIVGTDVKLNFSYYGSHNRVRLYFGANKVNLNTIIALRDELFSDCECYVKSIMETQYVGSVVLEVVVVDV